MFIPPSQGKVPYYGITEEAITSIVENAGDNVSKALMSHIQGISPLIADEIVFESGQSPSTVFRVLTDMVNRVCSENAEPRVYLHESGSPFDFHLFPLISISDYYQEVCFQNISEAITYFYNNKSSSNRIRQKASDLDRAIGNSLDKLYLKKQRLSEDLLKAENSDVYRLYGELITANLHQVKQGTAKVELTNYYNGETVSINLDPRFSPIQNAQRYYKKYSKAKTAVTEKNIQLDEANSDIAYLESVLSYIEKAGSVEEIEELRQELVEGGYLRRRKNNFKPSKSKPSPYQYTTADGFRVLVGRNNKENDLLTFKTASGKDIWFHTKDIPGSHVILFTDGKIPTEKSIFESASLAAYHSKARGSENVPVDYTQVRHVKKPNGAKPGMVIFTDNRTVYVNPKLPASGSSDKTEKF